MRGRASLGGWLSADGIAAAGQCRRGQRARAGEGDRAGVIGVLLAEDQATTRGALAALLGLAGDIEVVA